MGDESDFRPIFFAGCCEASAAMPPVFDPAASAFGGAMLSVDQVDIDRYLRLGTEFNRFDVTGLRDFYSKKNRSLWCISLLGKPIAVFCVNNGPDFRCFQFGETLRARFEKKHDINDCFEIIGLSIDVKHRKTWVSTLCWTVLFYMVMNRDRSTLIFGTIEDRIRKLYETSGLQPAFDEKIDLKGQQATVWLYVVDRKALPLRFARALGMRLLMSSPLCAGLVRERRQGFFRRVRIPPKRNT